MARVTMKDLARETGLTVATVSRALSGKDQIADATRGRVRDAAERLGYEPDPALSRLAAWRWGAEPAAESGLVLAVLSDDERPRFPDYVENRLKGIRARGRELGYGIEILRLREHGNSPERLADVVRARGIAGVVVERVNRPGSFEGFPWNEIPAVGCGLGEEHLAIPTVTNDVYESVRMAWARCRARGYRRIGLVLALGGKPDPFHRMLAAGRLEQEESGEEEATIPPLRCEARNLPSELPSWLKEWRPDVVIGNQYTAEHLEELGLMIPRKIAFAGFAVRAERGSRWSGAQVRLREVGILALEQCHLAIQRPGSGGVPIDVLHLVKPRWTEGDSLPEVG